MKTLTTLLIPLVLTNCIFFDDEPSPVTDDVSVGVPVDMEGYEYPTVQIGNQLWMAENLKTTKYRNGDDIETTQFLHEDIEDAYMPNYQWAYSGNENFVEEYGRLYTWYVAVDPREVCPEGWKLPNNDDWTILANYLGGVDVAGNALKETGITHWHPQNEYATNESGFTAIPAGYRKPDGEFRAIGYRTRWWSSTDTQSDNGWRFGVDYDSQGVSFNSKYAKSAAYSIRCMRYVDY